MRSKFEDYRIGAIGALIDEHERAINDFLNLLKDIPNIKFEKIVDRITSDDNCRSIQTVCSHMVSSGYGYSNLIRRNVGVEETISFSGQIDKIDNVQNELDKMMIYMIQTLDNLTEYINAPWDLVIKATTIDLNLDLLLEHSIVHILRHRRQIEKFILKLQLQ